MVGTAYPLPRKNLMLSPRQPKATGAIALLEWVLPIAAGRPVRRRLPGILLEGPNESLAVLGVRPLNVPGTEPGAGFLQQS